MVSLIVSSLSYSAENPHYDCGKKNCSLDIPTVSIISLIANPERYNGKTIRVEGYISLEFEGSAIYLDRSHFENNLSINAIWLKLDEWGKKQTYCHLAYCFVQGVFKADEKGHFSSFSGSIHTIYRMETVLTNEEYQRMILDEKNREKYNRSSSSDATMGSGS